MIRGRDWFDHCNDVTGPGCFGPEPGVSGPTQDLRIDLKRAGSLDFRTVATGIDADEEFRIESTFVVPELRPGSYVIVVYDDSLTQPEVELPFRIHR